MTPAGEKYMRDAMALLQVTLPPMPQNVSTPLISNINSQSSQSNTMTTNQWDKEKWEKFRDRIAPVIEKKVDAIAAEPYDKMSILKQCIDEVIEITHDFVEDKEKW